MAVPFLNSITLNKNEIQEFKVFNIGTGDPTLASGGDKGYFWTDTATSVLKWWDGTNIRTLLDSASTISVADNLSGGAAGSLPYQLTASDTTFLGIGTANQVLTVKTDLSGPQWTSQSNLSVGTATFLAGGAQGSIPVQSAAGTTGFLTIGAAGRILTSDGTTPVWSATIPSSSVSGLAASATTDTTNAANITSGLLPLARLELADGSFYVGNGSNVPTATAKNLIPISGFGAATAAVAMGNQKITGLADPVDATDAANRKYVDEVAQGLDVKASCLTATTANIDLSAPTASIGGVTISTVGSRVLVKDQTNKTQNGIYLWQGASSAMTRSLDADTVAKLVGAFTFVEQGTNADSGWVCQVDSGTIGSVDIEWTKFSQAGSYTAGNGMVLSGGVFHFAQDTNYTAGRIPFASGNTTIGFSSSLNWDNANSRLGIGNAPSYKLDVSGDTRLRAAGTLYLDNSDSTNQYYWQNTGASGANNATLVLSRTNVGPTMTVDRSGNLGLGETPKAWNSSIRAFQIGSYSSIADFLGYSQFANNFYNDGTDKFINAAAATRYFQVSGTHNWQRSTNASPTAGGAATMETSMVLDASGKLILTGAVGYEDALKITNGRVQLGHSNGGSGIWFNTATTANKWFAGLDGDTFRFYSGTLGSDAVRISDTGNVGVGVVPNTWASGGNINLPSSAGIVSKGVYLNVGTNYYYDGAFKYVGAGRATLFNQGDGAFQWQNAANNTGPAGAALSFSPLMTLDASGNLGVGVAPTSRLTVLGSDATSVARFNAASGRLRFAPYSSYQSTNGVILDSTNTAENAYQPFAIAGSSVFLISDSGNCVLTSDGRFRVSTQGSASTPAFSRTGDIDTGLYFPADNTLALAVGGSDAVYIHSSRNIAFGTPNVVNLSGYISLAINGTTGSFTDYQQNSVSYLRIGADSSSGFITDNGSNTPIRILTNGTERLRIKSTGQLNFSGLNSAPTGAVGDLYYNSTSNTLQYHNNSAFQQISRKYSTALAGTNTSFTVTHNFGTRDVTVQVRKSGSTYDLVYTDVQMTTENAVTVIFASSVTGSDYTVTVIG